MPRPAILAGGAFIAIAAVAGLALGVVRDIKGRGGPDADAGDIVAPIKTVANATPLVAPPVTEADVRRWAREELSAQRAAAPKKAKVEGDDGDPAGADTATPPTGATTQPSTPAAPPPAKPASGQIPF